MTKLQNKYRQMAIDVQRKLNTEIFAGLEFARLGATETARKDTLGYCTNLSQPCDNCPLVNYGRDCHNNPLGR
jgi:hypothetical protein